MCGIVGYIGKEQAAPILLEGLSRLEYRGYDSAGICVAGEGRLQLAKSKGRLKNLIEMTNDGATLHGMTGIGHTRWATHGEPNDTNSHPHISEDGKIALVHNGIIENYMELRQYLQEKGVHFTSETDSEVVAQLLDHFYKETGSVLDALYMVLHRIEGAYALGILCADEPDRIYAARKDAPLLIGYGDGCSFIASDVTALVKYTRDVTYMEDGEVAVLTTGGVTVRNAMEQIIVKEHHHIDWEISAAEKGGYPHFMLKEIMEEPDALRRTLSPRIHDGRIVFEGMKLSDEALRGIHRISIIACGSSYHVGVIGKYNIEKLTRIPVEVSLASEFRYSDPILDDKTLCIVISQSGETLDTMAALREAKARGARILSLVNVANPTTSSTPGPGPRSPWQRPRPILRSFCCSTCSACIWLTSARRSRRRGIWSLLPKCSACRRSWSRSSPTASRSSITPHSILTTIPCSSSAGIWITRSGWRARSSSRRSRTSTLRRMPRASSSTARSR